MTHGDAVCEKGRKQGAKLLSLGGDPGRWAVSDSELVLATAQTRLARYQLDIDARGRHLTARMPGMLQWGLPKEFEVVDDATGEKVIDGKLTSGGHTRPRDEEWAVTLPTGGTISWIYKREARKGSSTLGRVAVGAPARVSADGNREALISPL